MIYLDRTNAGRELAGHLSESAERPDAIVLALPFHGVGAWYADFTQTTDDEVRASPERSRHAAATRA